MHPMRVSGSPIHNHDANFKMYTGNSFDQVVAMSAMRQPDTRTVDQIITALSLLKGDTRRLSYAFESCADFVLFIERLLATGFITVDEAADVLDDAGYPSDYLDARLEDDEMEAAAIDAEIQAYLAEEAFMASIGNDDYWEYQTYRPDM